MKGLVVDFADRDRGVAARALAEAGFEVHAVADLPSARRALLDSADVAVVVCGAGLAAELRAAAPSALMLVTAWPDELPAAIATLDAVAFDALAKPLSAEAIAGAARRVCEHQRATGELAGHERALAAERARLLADADQLEREAGALAQQERLHAELSETVAADLMAVLAPVPAALEGVAAAGLESGPRSAIVDGAFASRQAMRMIADLLDTDRAERAPLSSAPRALSLAAFLHGLVAGLERVAADYDAAVDLSIAGDLTEFHADPDLLGRTLDNLLETALRRSRRGRVRFEVESHDSRVRFTIADGGPALPERLVANLFDRASRLEPGSVQRGAGFGFCRAAAAALGGTLLAERDGERGLRLTLEVPRDARVAGGAKRSIG